MDKMITFAKNQDFRSILDSWFFHGVKNLSIRKTFDFFWLKMDFNHSFCSSSSVLSGYINRFSLSFWFLNQVYGQLSEKPLQKSRSSQKFVWTGRLKFCWHEIKFYIPSCRGRFELSNDTKLSFWKSKFIIKNLMINLLQDFTTRYIK